MRNITTTVTGPRFPMVRRSSAGMASTVTRFYGQDTWKVKPTLTLTFGVRWSLFSPPWETNGLQVSPAPGLGQWYLDRANAGANGIPSNQDAPVIFQLVRPGEQCR